MTTATRRVCHSDRVFALTQLVTHSRHWARTGKLTAGGSGKGYCIWEACSGADIAMPASISGPAYRALPPLDGEITHLPAGGSVTFEIACHVAWTSYGVATTVPGSALDACPGNTGAYHSGDPASLTIDNNLLSGCALGIADVDNIEDVTMDNLAIFSVNKQCVKQKMTSFQVPARMPACSSPKGCICGWFWLANNGTGNYCELLSNPRGRAPS